MGKEEEREREEVSDGGREEGRYRKRGRERQRKERGSYSDLLAGRAAQGSLSCPGVIISLFL